MLRPFDVYLPRADLAGQVVAPPYDTLGFEETQRAPPGNLLGFLNLVRSEIDHPELDPARRHEILAETSARLRGLIAGGVYEHYPPPAYLVVQLEAGGHRQVGVIADVALDAYDEGRVKVHEATRRGQEDRLVEYMELVRANFLPVFLVHRPTPSIDSVVGGVTAAAPTLALETADGIRVTIWLAPAKDVARIGKALAHLPELYVADGHHRLAAAARYARARGTEPGAAPSSAHQGVLAVLFPSDQLVIREYNRVVTDLGGWTPAELVVTLASRLEVEPVAGPGSQAARPRARGEIAAYLGGAWYRVTFPDELVRHPGVAGLDVALLESQVLAPLLGIEDSRSDERVDFVPGTLGMGELERMCRDGYAAAFALHPVAIDELMEASDRAELMPPKSTWFAPKLPSGLVIRLL